MEQAAQGRVLIVDDIAQNIQVAMSILQEDSYEFSFANDAQQALGIAKTQSFDLILLDVMMPKINGFELCRLIKEDSANEQTPIIFLTGRSDQDSISEGFEAGGVDYITKPFHAEELLSRVRVHTQLYRSQKLLQQRNVELAVKTQLQNQRLLKEIELSHRETIYILMEVMESTSDETGAHIKRVAESSRLLARYVPTLSEEDERIIFHASPMHDIGKIMIPKSILHKPGKLTEQEYELMKTHAKKGRDLLLGSGRKLLNAASIISHQHHEKWDGSGYPRGLKGDEIHVYGRIVALADVFDALTHKRQYKEAWDIDRAVAHIIESRGSHFDPELVDIFIEHLDEFVAIVEQTA
ncbi:MAG: HD domain-containing phosphohydrolase [Pseudomonadales bacterium]